MIVVVQAVAERYRGFLQSVMPEVAAGVFVDLNLSKGVRERVQTVIEEWWEEVPGGTILMAWKQNDAPGGLALFSLGTPTRELVDLDGVLLTRR